MDRHQHFLPLQDALHVVKRLLVQKLHWHRVGATADSNGQLIIGHAEQASLRRFAICACPLARQARRVFCEKLLRPLFGIGWVRRNAHRSDEVEPDSRIVEVHHSHLPLSDLLQFLLVFWCKRREGPHDTLALADKALYYVAAHVLHREPRRCAIDKLPGADAGDAREVLRIFGPALCLTGPRGKQAEGPNSGE